MTATFLDAWEAATSQQRCAPYAALQEYVLSGESELLDTLFIDVPAASTAYLPKNWRLLMRRIVERDDLRLFPARIMDAITNYGTLEHGIKIATGWGNGLAKHAAALATLRNVP